MTVGSDNFPDDPSGRWTALGGTAWAWDATNFDIDFNTAGDALLRYDTAPGSIEHEAQCTAVSNATRPMGVALRVHNSTTFDGYTVGWANADSYQIQRFVAGVRTLIATTAATGLAALDFYTVRASAEGGDGANVVLRGYFIDHNSTTKPSDPGLIGDVDTPAPDISYTDTDATRLDDVSVHLYTGMGGRGGGADYDSQNDFFKMQAISDRAAAASSRIFISEIGLPSYILSR